MSIDDLGRVRIGRLALPGTYRDLFTGKVGQLYLDVKGVGQTHKIVLQAGVEVVNLTSFDNVERIA